MYTKTVLTGAAITALLLTALTAAPAAPATPAAPAAPAAPAVAPTGTVLGACGPGRLCLWPKPDFKGRPWTHELATTDIDSCVALPPGTSAQSLANRTGRPVTTYQSAECGETGEFETYPGRGTWVPQTAYEVRAFKLWER
ncbi:peptidase inhibitor family I36 [Streptomyces sp. PanSC19]|uniref:peptidase inhibitor family I36 protein n=1 Tax=Streptomyces sp. PanSC19 TaxID=1520455 RepID=UPI000F4787DD|nr:peptidase inhibitor family I36 protein [Streptomyces sp. PanSC19]ROQ32119.1 peptidase inhibitor family I36 [Streptomyces sp. PanSC19]